jgi:CDGSH-type Zn-finger protein
MVSAVLQLQIEDAERCWSKTCGTPKTAESPPKYDWDGGTMARIVKRTRGGPYPVTIGGETKHICGCGLSNTQPFCNGTHKIARQEEPNKLYWYDEQGNRFETTDSYQGIRCPQE